MECGCGKYIKSERIDIVDSTLLITIPNREYMNDKNYGLCIAQCIPKDTLGPKAVMIADGKNKYALIDKTGHYVYSDQLRPRNIYCIRGATDTGSFVYYGYQRLPKTEFKFNCSFNKPREQVK